MTTPTADAIRLAVKLSGHTACERWWIAEYDSSGVCAGCLGDAATIDRELLLPQKHAALLLAQGVVDAEFRDTLTLIGAIDELREALNQIKT